MKKFSIEFNGQTPYSPTFSKYHKGKQPLIIDLIQKDVRFKRTNSDGKENLELIRFLLYEVIFLLNKFSMLKTLYERMCHISVV